MNKKALMDYVDTCELIKETEYEISRMRKIEMEHAEDMKHEIEKWMNTIPSRMQRII